MSQFATSFVKAKYPHKWNEGPERESELEPDVNEEIEAMQQERLDKLEEDHLEFNH